MSEWQLVPKQPTREMMRAADTLPEVFSIGDEYAAMLAAAPKPADTLTPEQAAQHWRGMDGATAFHLIDRHAEGWGGVGAMMNAWLAANKDAP